MKQPVDSSRRSPLLSAMKTRLLFLAAGLLAGGQIFAVSPTIPQRPPPEDFKKLTEDWPFALATPAAPVAEPVSPWSANLYVSGIGRNYDNGKEEVFVAIKKRDGTGGFSLFGNQTNTAEDISVGGIEWSDKIGESKVTLKKGSEFATVKFDEAALQSSSPQNPGQVRPGMPNPPGVRPPMIRPPGGAVNTVPRPTNVPLPQNVSRTPMPPPMPSNTNSLSPNVPPNISPNPNTPTGPRTRVRVINSPP